jgi:acyl-CoA thioester hydrolase
VTGPAITPDGWFRHTVAVRFRDLDPMGHAHHTLPLVYLEEARAAFWRQLRGPDLADIDYVMAEVTVRFHARIGYPSELVVGIAVTDVGRSSFRTDFEIRDAAGGLLSSGSAVQVAYDYGASAARPLEGAVRDALLGWLAARQANMNAMVADTAPMMPPRT